MNLRWSWDQRTRDLFRWVDPEAWDAVVHDPVRLLGESSRPERLAELAARHGLPALPRRRSATDLDRYLDPRRVVPGPRRQPAALGRLLLPRVRHHRGAAPVLRRPRRARRRPPQGGQRPRRARSSASACCTATATSARRSTPTAGRRSATPTSTRTAWRSRSRTASAVTRRPRRRDAVRPRSGRPRSAGSRSTCSTPTSTRTATPAARVTDRLYGGDGEHRLRQEILLGIGGVRALRALGVDTQVFHTNEGHAGFLGLERIRELVIGDGLSFAEAVEAVRAGGVFTTHTPVPAGIDRFPRELIEKYFTGVRRRGRRRHRRPARRSASEPADDARQAVQHGGHGPAPGRPLQRRGQAPRRGQPGDVPAAVARRPRRRGARSGRSPTACTPAPGSRPRWTTC